MSKKAVHMLNEALKDRFAMKDKRQVSLTFGTTVTRDYNTGTLTTTRKDNAPNISYRFETLDYRTPHTSV